MQFSGLFYHNERYADNREHLRQCLKNPEYAKLSNMTEEQIKRELEFMAKFPPEKAHDRLVGHKVHGYLVKDFAWVSARKLYFIAKGGLERIFTVDVGKELRKACEDELHYEEIVEEDVAVDMGDGTEVRGARVKTSPYNGSAKNREIPNPFLEIFCDSSGYGKTGCFNYTFDIKEDSITLAEPKEFRVETYVLIDGEKVFSETHIGRSMFAGNKLGNEDVLKPSDFSYISFRKTIK